MATFHILDRLSRGYGRGLSALEIAAAHHRSGWDCMLLLSGVSDHALLPAETPHEALLNTYGTDVCRQAGEIGHVAAALGRRTRATDVLVCHGGVDLAAACRLGERRVIAAVHGDPNNYLGYLPNGDLAAIRRRTSHWMVWGTAAARRLSECLAVAPTSISIVGQHVKPRRPDLVQKLPGSPACLTPARLHPVKNHALMLRALALLVPQLPGIRWHMAGDVEDREYYVSLRDDSAQLGVDDLVTWHGHRHDIEALMLGCDVVVLASHTEGIPRAIQEAMVLQVRTVMPSALAHDLRQAGLPVCYDGDRPEALARAISNSLLVDDSRVAAAATWVTKRWSQDSAVEDWRFVVDPEAGRPDRRAS